MRYIGVDLHTNSITACYLEKSEGERVETFPLQNGGLERFLETLSTEDEVAIEATSNSAWFRDQVVGYVSRVVVIAPWQFEVIRRSVKKTDKHDARAIALFLSKDMLPEARLKNKHHVEIASLIATRDQLIKLKVSLLNKVHGLFVRHGLKISKATLTTKKGFEKAISQYKWMP